MDTEYGGDISDELLLNIYWDDVVSHTKGKESVDFKEKENESSLNSHSSTELDNQQVEDIGDDSDAPSWIYEDLEDSEDDIQMQQLMNKEKLRKKLQKLIQSKKTTTKKYAKAKKKKQEDTSHWYSSCDDDDELESIYSSEDEYGPKKNKVQKIMWNDKIGVKNWNPVVGTMFTNANHYRDVIRDWSCRNGISLKWLKSDQKRVTVKCKQGCEWKMHASQVNGQGLAIKNINGAHTCIPDKNNDTTDYKYIAKRLKNSVMDNPNEGIKALRSKIIRKLGSEVSKSKVSRAKKHVLREIEGELACEYEILRDYAETVMKCNPGSRVLLRRNIDVPNEFIFQRMYWRLAAMKDGFLAGCRPIIVLDGGFLKTVHGGQLLSAGRDGNDNMWPLGLVVVEVECKDSWEWFLEEFLYDYRSVEEMRWTFISDRQKGLIEAFKRLMPNVEHRFCLRHMYDTFKKKFKSQELKDLFWKAASTGNKNEFDIWMKKIEVVDPKISENVEIAAEWIQNIPAVHWARSHFPTTSKCDILVNNLSESFNSYILEAREKPIISMLEWIRRKLMSNIQIKKEGMSRHPHAICPNIMRKINKTAELTRRSGCHALYCGSDEYEVEHFDKKYIVKLQEKSCTCGMFQLSGYPCCHAMAAFGKHHRNLEEYVSPFFKKDMYLMVYEHMIHGLPGRNEYVKSSPFKPPFFRRKPGRPKKKRNKSVDEKPNTNKMSKKGLSMTCKNFLQTGHNKRTCKNPRHSKSK